MKSYILKTVCVALLIVIAALAGVSCLRNSQREAQFNAERSGVAAILSLQAAAINDEYFSWSLLRGYIKSGELESAKGLLDKVEGTYPLVDKLELVKGDPPEADYEIQGSGSDFILTFGIKDDQGGNTLPNWKAQVNVNAQAILDSLLSVNRIVVDPVHGENLVNSLKAGFTEPLLGWIDYLFVALATILLGYPSSVFIWRRNVYFYESKGLESIIFLFEQTEKLSANHSRQVARLAAFLGEKTGYSKSRLRNLYTAALLHDIGKINISSGILLKEGPLTEAEQSVMMTHPIISARILKNFKELSHLSTAVLYHHERIDGSGYPEGLKGEQIPEEARIIAVVDVFEALTGNRPYREPLCVKEAFALLRDMSLDKRITSILEAEFNDFKTYHPPRWVVAYDRTL
ncbi:MAG: HD-GYP domain-containing protein [Spirochaetes bacterium]|nr:HD-GYP domain-containing protein [Spirochaetota bacterium]